MSALAPFPETRGIVLLGHGSRDPGTADEIQSLRDALGTNLPGHRLAHAFLNQDPRLEYAVESLIAAGCSTVRVLPLLVFTGHHVAHDVPEAIERLRALHPHTPIELSPHLFRLPGFSALLTDALRTPESRP